MILTKHFTLEELTISQHRNIDNKPSLEVIENLKALAKYLEKIRSALQKPIVISSAYRSSELNTAVGGSESSRHIQGLAADFISPRAGTPLEICRAIIYAGIQFDQLIYEYGKWVHFGICKKDGKMRGEVLHIFDKKIGYINGLPKKKENLQ